MSQTIKCLAHGNLIKIATAVTTTAAATLWL